MFKRQRERMVTLGKLVAPKPGILPCKTKTNAGQHANIALVPESGGWGTVAGRIQAGKLLFFGSSGHGSSICPRYKVMFTPPRVG